VFSIYLNKQSQLRAIIVLSFILITPLANKLVYAQNYIYKNFTSANGFPNSRVLCFARDNYNSVFIGTSVGLFKYSGNNFNPIFNKENLKTVGDNSVQNLLFDGVQYLWIATRTTVSRYDVIHSKFVPISKNNNLNLKLNLVHNLFLDAKKNIWIAPDNRNPISYNLNGDSVASPDFKKFILENNYSHKLYITINKFAQKSEK